MMLRSHRLARLIAALLMLAGLIVVLERGGLIGWSALLLGAALLLKTSLKPSGLDLMLGSGFAAACVLVWVAAFYYVIHTWESGEVVELVIDTGSGTHTARLWVLDMEEDPLIYYDATAEAAESLLAGKPLQFTRADVVSTRIPRATRIEALPEAEAARILEAMEAKYGDRLAAATVFYGLLGRPRGRVALVASLSRQQDASQALSIRKRPAPARR